MTRLQFKRDAAASEPAIADGGWLTLEQASRRLGVHPSTLRRWTNEGAIDVLLTPGGHRRFRTTDLERFERERRRGHLPAAGEARWTDHAIAQTRHGLLQQRWLASYDEAEREIKRRLGRRLMGLLFQYVARPDEGGDLLLEARIIGEEHGRSGLRNRQPLADLLQAINFRTALVELALLEQPESITARPEAGVRLLHRVEGLLDEVQTGVVEIYSSGGRE